MIIGAAIAIAGLVFVVLGFKGSFKKDLQLPPSGTARSVVTGLGVVGYIAEGVALFLVGLLFIISTVQANPQESTGLDGGSAARAAVRGVYADRRRRRPYLLRPLPDGEGQIRADVSWPPSPAE